MTKRTKKQTTQAPSTINSTAPSKPIEVVKAQTNTQVTPKVKQAKTQGVKPTEHAPKPTVAKLQEEQANLTKELIYANAQLIKAKKDLDAVTQNFISLSNCSWWSITYSRFTQSLFLLTKYFR